MSLFHPKKPGPPSASNLTFGKGSSYNTNLIPIPIPIPILSPRRANICRPRTIDGKSGNYDSDMSFIGRTDAVDGNKGESGADSSSIGKTKTVDVDGGGYASLTSDVMVRRKKTPIQQPKNHIKDSDSNSFIHRAVFHNNLEGIQFALDHKADINQRGVYCPHLYTVIHEFCTTDILQTLVNLLPK